MRGCHEAGSAWPSEDSKKVFVWHEANTTNNEDTEMKGTRDSGEERYVSDEYEEYDEDLYHLRADQHVVYQRRA